MAIEYYQTTSSILCESPIIYTNNSLRKIAKQDGQLNDNLDTLHSFNRTKTLRERSSNVTNQNYPLFATSALVSEWNEIYPPTTSSPIKRLLGPKNTRNLNLNSNSPSDYEDVKEIYKKAIRDQFRKNFLENMNKKTEARQSKITTHLTTMDSSSHKKGIDASEVTFSTAYSPLSTPLDKSLNSSSSQEFLINDREMSFKRTSLRNKSQNELLTMTSDNKTLTLNLCSLVSTNDLCCKPISNKAVVLKDTTLTKGKLSLIRRFAATFLCKRKPFLIISTRRIKQVFVTTTQQKNFNIGGK